MGDDFVFVKPLAGERKKESVSFSEKGWTVSLGFGESDVVNVVMFFMEYDSIHSCKVHLLFVWLLDSLVFCLFVLQNETK